MKSTKCFFSDFAQEERMKKTFKELSKGSPTQDGKKYAKKSTVLSREVENTDLGPIHP